MASGAWLIDLGRGLVAATGELELIHVVPEPELQVLPGAPAHCRNVLVWQGKALPALDLPVQLGHPAQATAFACAAIAAYQERPGAVPSYGVLLLADLPRRIEVSDDQGCGLPEELASLRNLASSCFEHGGQAVPIVNLAMAFAAVADSSVH